MDYAIPRADVLPDIEVLSTVTPSPHHPLGVKGIGEAGTIASTVHGLQRGDRRAASRSACDDLPMPLTPERVWRAMQTREDREPDHVRTSLRLPPRRVAGRGAAAAAAHPGAKLLAGGHSLMPLMKLRLARPEALVDIGRIAELKGISAAERRRADRRADDPRRAGGVATSCARSCPVLAEAAAHDRRPAGAQPRHHRRQRRARRPGVRPADGAVALGATVRRRPAPSGARDHRRRATSSSA